MTPTTDRTRVINWVAVYRRMRWITRTTAANLRALGRAGIRADAAARRMRVAMGPYKFDVWTHESTPRVKALHAKWEAHYDRMDRQAAWARLPVKRHARRGVGWVR